MQLRYDEDFAEAAAFLCASGRRPGTPSLQIARFHRQREKLYSILDPDERNAAFFALHLDWFREWGLEQPLTAALREFPLLPAKLDVLAIRKPHGKDDEGAELYVNEAGRRNGVLALRPERFMDGATLADVLRHEFTHLHDMLDPAFGYAPALELPGLNAAQQRLARERYRLLWDLTIDGRLATAGHTPMAAREQHGAAFARAYSFWPVEKQTAMFDALWSEPAPRHAQLLALIADPRGLRGTNRPAPGGSCPLCGFPTFAWAASETLPPHITARILAESPNWSPEQGLCGRCRETYEATASSIGGTLLVEPIMPAPNEPEQIAP